MWRSLLAVLFVATTARGDVLRVGKIHINAGALFDASEIERSPLLRVVDAMHAQTPVAFLRSFLLFREGDPFDASLLRESERKLRSLDFLESASVTAGVPHQGLVDVTVQTTDAFTTAVNADFSNDGGRSLYDLDLIQKDILGTGAEADVRFASGRERTTRSLELGLPYLFSPYWNADLLLAANSDGNEVKLLVDRPLASHRTTNTFRLETDNLRQRDRIYRNGAVESLFRQRHSEQSVRYGRVVAVDEQSATRVVGGIDFIDDRFRASVGPDPADRRFRFVEGGIQRDSFRFITLNQIDLGSHEQDFGLGLQTAFYAAVSPSQLDKKRYAFRVRTDNSLGRSFPSGLLVLTRLSAVTRIGTVNRNLIVSSDTRFVQKAGSRYPLTLAGRFRADYGDDLDRDVQFFADGQNGLRAFPNFAFSGSRRMLLNVEERMALGRDWLDLFEPGAALFIDSGRAYGQSQRGQDHGMKTDAGLGFRVAIPRYQSAVLRFDLAWAFNASPLSRRGLVFSFATSQAF